MKLQKTPRIIAVTLALAFSAAWPVPGHPQSAADQAKPDNTKPDNTRVNKRDRNPAEATADRQKMNAADRKLSEQIRKSIFDDKILSTYAHNVKVISQDGIVTLKGPVRSDDEVKSIMDKAVEVAGSADKVVNQMSVKP
jgi:hyperosmotically inducible periplasmic protein